MAIMTHAKFDFNWPMLTLIFGIWASEPPPGPGERLKRPGLIGLSSYVTRNTQDFSTTANVIVLFVLRVMKDVILICLMTTLSQFI